MKTFNIIDALAHLIIAGALMCAGISDGLYLLSIIYCFCLGPWQLFGMCYRFWYKKEKKNRAVKKYIFLGKALGVSLLLIPLLGLMVGMFWILISCIMAVIYLFILIDSFFKL